MSAIGNPRTLTDTFTDSTGTPVSPSSVTLSVIDPAGTQTDNLTTTTAVAGTYTAAYTPLLAGRYLWRMVSTGPVTKDDWEIFNVQDISGALISVDDAKKSIGRTDSTYDDEILGYTTAITPILEDICGDITFRTTTITVDGGTNAIPIPGGRPIAVTAVTESGVATTNFRYDAVNGILYGGNGYNPRQFLGGLAGVTITYTSGFTVTPSNLILAAKEQFRFMWQVGRQGTSKAFGAGPDDSVFTPSGYAVPRRVIELCSPHRRAPGVG